MKVGIVTIYEPLTNLGSYLQAYALKIVLEDMGHDVYFIEKVSIWKAVKNYVCKLNPKRAFFLRFCKANISLKAIKKLKRVSIDESEKQKFDCLIYGSDEIWNLENPYFRHDLFWGKTNYGTPKIAYAVSVGAMTEETLTMYQEYVEKISDFKSIYVRDEWTKNVIGNILKTDLTNVCDPTFLLPVSRYAEEIEIPKKKYMLVYTYGVDAHIEKVVREFAEKNNLVIISVGFWHLWVDKVIECSPLQFAKLIEGAEYVFTTTFHGAIFTMLNHKKCCILPMREKVRDVVQRMSEQNHLISDDCTLEEFTKTMNIEFDTSDFEERLEVYRNHSLEYLRGALECLNK